MATYLVNLVQLVLINSQVVYIDVFKYHVGFIFTKMFFDIFKKMLYIFSGIMKKKLLRFHLRTHTFSK